MHLIAKFNPLSLKFMQLLLKHKNIYYNANRTVLKTPIIQRNVFITIASLVFIWPVKKINKGNAEDVTDKLPSSLDTSDSLFENGRYEECYNLLSNIKDQDNIEVQWRICRVLYNMSKEPKYEKPFQRKLILQAYEIIANQLESNQQHFAVHKWYALLLDAKSSYDGIKEKIRQLETVKKHMDLAVTINPQDATILHMLGEWCYQITELPWHQRKIAEVLFASPPRSTYEDALEYFLRAESVQPRFYSLNLLRLGNCYLKLKKVDQAKYYLKLAASYPAKSNDDHRANKEAAELLKNLK